MAVLTPEEIRKEEEDPEWLQSQFFLWKRHCDVKPLFVSWIRDTLRHKIANLVARGDGNSTLQVCSIGSGHGEFDLELMQMLNEAHPEAKAHFTVVERSSDAVTKFKASVTGLGSAILSSMTFSWLEMPYDEYVEQYIHGNYGSTDEGSLSVPKKYDIAILVNSLCHIGDYKERIPEIMEFLSDNGCMILVGATHNSLSASIAELAHPEWGGDGAELYLEKIVEFLTHTQQKFSLSRRSTDFTTPRTFDKGSIYGNRLLNLLTFNSDVPFRQGDDPELIESIISKLKKAALIKEVNGVKVEYFLEEFGFIVVDK